MAVPAWIMTTVLPMIMVGTAVSMLLLIAGMRALSVAMLAGEMSVMVVRAIVPVGAALRLERPIHRRRRAALPARHVGEHRILLDVEGLRGHLGRRVPVADVVGDLEKTQRVLGAQLQEALRRGLYLDEAAVFQHHGVAVIEHGGLVEVEEEVEPGIALQSDSPAVAAFVIEGHSLRDAVRRHGRFSDDRRSAEHG